MIAFLNSPFGFSTTGDEQPSAPGTLASSEANFPGFGQVRLVCDATGAQPRLYAEVSSADFEQAQGPPPLQLADNSEFALSLSPDCDQVFSSYKHLFLSWALSGHPPWDMRSFAGGRDGGYGTPHFDAHFYTISVDERESRMHCPTLLDGSPAQCDTSAPDAITAQFLNLPEPAQTTGFFAPQTFGGTSVRYHGTHLHTEADRAIIECQSTGPIGDWRDCANQFVSAFPKSVGTCGRPGCAFQDSNCACGHWDDGVSPVLNVFGGEVIGHEIMSSYRHLQLLKAGDLQNPYFETIPTPDMPRPMSGSRASRTMTELTVESKFRFGIMLGAGN